MAAFKSVVAGSTVITAGSKTIAAVKAISRGKATSAVEFDYQERDALVYLFTCPLPSFINSEEFHHWALVLLFEGEDVRTVEGLVDEETKLFAKYAKVPPNEDGKYYLLGQCYISPKNLLELCMSNSYNKQEYLPTWQNCQSWAKELARKLGEDISKQIDNHKTLMEVRPFLARIGQSSSTLSNFSSRPYQKMFNVSKQSSGKQA